MDEYQIKQFIAWIKERYNEMSFTWHTERRFNHLNNLLAEICIKLEAETFNKKPSVNFEPHKEDEDNGLQELLKAFESSKELSDQTVHAKPSV